MLDIKQIRESHKSFKSGWMSRGNYDIQPLMEWANTQELEECDRNVVANWW